MISPGLVCRSLAVAGLILAPRAFSATGEPVTLIGYGAVQAAFSGDGASFKCQDEEHADILLDKLKADLTWDRQAGVHNIKLSNGAPGYQLNGVGVLVVARIGATVRCFAGAAPDAVVALMNKARVDPEQAVYAAAKPHPASLDGFDLNAVRMSIESLKPNLLDKGPGAYTHDALAKVVNSWAALGIGMGVNLRTFMSADSRVDGPPHLFPTDYEIKLARETGMSVNMFFGPCGGTWWLRNRFPDQMDQTEGISAWAPTAANQGTPHISYCMDDAVRAYVDRYDLDVLHNVREAAGDSLSGIRISTGRPGDEMSFHWFSYELMDRSPADLLGFQTWVREKRRLDLAALGARWYGDPDHFHSWAEVLPPSIFEFYGNYGQGTLDLDRDWLWRPDADASAAEQWGGAAYRPGPEWTPVDLMPSKRQLLLLSATKEGIKKGEKIPAGCWFRKEFDPSAWLLRNPGKPVYLAVEPYNHDLPVRMYLNGSYLGAIPVRNGLLNIDVTSKLQAGHNLLCLELTKDRLILGPVFLTTTKPASYPCLGPYANARWVDLRDWLVDKMIDGYSRIAAPVREEAPDIPVLLVPGSEWSIADHFLDLKRTSGFSALHNTGSEVSYISDDAGLGYVIGAYASSEEAGELTDTNRLSEELAWFLLNAAGTHNYVYDPGPYMKLEQSTGWFSKNRRLLGLVGKSLWVKPSVALLRSAKNEAYFPRAHRWDLGRGQLESTHRNNVYVTEAELKAGLADDYPLLIDQDSLIMDGDTVAAIKRYVENGGTFIASENTGRDTPLVPDVWPISDVTGFKVTGTETSQPLAIEPDSPLPGGFSGRSFNTSGMALQPADGRARAVALWKDGSVAIGLRPLGKGKVITVASDFWHNNAAFLASLLEMAGVKPEVDCDDGKVWTRREITKNGLQEWVLAYNHDQVNPRPNVNLTFARARKPARIFDMVTGADIPFDYTNGTVRISGLHLDSDQIRVLGMPMGSFSDALPVWYAEKTKYWRRVDNPLKSPPLPRPPYGSIVFDRMHFRPATESALTDLAWQREPIDQGGWKNASYGFWDEMGYPAQGVGLYRASFELPADAASHRYNLGLISYDTPVFYGNATLYLNGRKITGYKQHYWSNFETAEVTGAVRPGTNELAVAVQADEGRGGYAGEMALYPLETLRDERPLTAWNLFEGNTDSAQVTTPISKPGYFLRTETAIPAAWAGKPIYLEIGTGTVWASVLYVNGEPMALLSASAHPVGGVYQANITLAARPGQTNEIEIWPYSAIPLASDPGKNPVSKSTITLEKASLGVAGAP